MKSIIQGTSVTSPLICDRIISPLETMTLLDSDFKKYGQQIRGSAKILSVI